MDRRHGEDGYTLTELLVSMGVFALLLGLVAAATTGMVHDLTRQTGRTDNLDSTRKVFQILDKQVRYANAIKTPGTGTDGNYYVEFRLGNAKQQQTCYQWRWNVAANSLQYRTWLPPATPSPAPSWTTVGDGVYQSGSTSVFDLSLNLPSGTVATHQALTLTYISKHGNPATSTTSRVTLTAENTTSPTPPLSAFCTEVPRS